jgi:hypothetical protein
MKGEKVMEKTYSQKISGVFEIVCYGLLIPAVISLIYPVFFIIGGVLEGSAKMSLLDFTPFLIASPGVVLLFGYFKHTRDRLSEKYISALWIGTAVYNFLLLLPWLFAAASYLQSPKGIIEDGNWVGILIPLAIVAAYVAAIYFSLKAFTLEKFIRI